MPLTCRASFHTLQLHVSRTALIYDITAKKSTHVLGLWVNSLSWSGLNTCSQRTVQFIIMVHGKKKRQKEKLSKTRCNINVMHVEEPRTKQNWQMRGRKRKKERKNSGAVMEKMTKAWNERCETGEQGCTKRGSYSPRYKSILGQSTFESLSRGSKGERKHPKRQKATQGGLKKTNNNKKTRKTASVWKWFINWQWTNPRRPITYHRRRG